MITQSRLLFNHGRVGCATGLVRAPHVLAAEGALETTTVRLVNDTSICIAPEYMAEELLRAEGFTDVRYIEAPGIQQVALRARRSGSGRPRSAR